MTLPPALNDEGHLVDRCEDCRFYHRGEGTCHRHAPQPVMRFQCREWTEAEKDRGPTPNEVEWPYVDEDNHCGEFEPWPGGDEHEHLRHPRVQRRKEANPQEDKQKLLLKKVDELELSLRSTTCLKNNNIVYIGDLVQKTLDDLLGSPNFGRKSLNEIKEVLRQNGLCLGMKLPGWAPPTEATCIIEPLSCSAKEGAS